MSSSDEKKSILKSLRVALELKTAEIENLKRRAGREEIKMEKLEADLARSRKETDFWVMNDHLAHISFRSAWKLMTSKQKKQHVKIVVVEKAKVDEKALEEYHKNMNLFT
jgi:uncharacterized protein YehS (DUF1456 family)